MSLKKCCVIEFVFIKTYERPIFLCKKEAAFQNKGLAGVFLQGLKVKKKMVVFSWFTDPGSECNPAFPPDYLASDHCWLSGEIKLRRVT